MSVLLAAGSPKALWFATRGAGTVAFLLLSANVVLGIAGVQRVRSRKAPRFLLAGLHRNLTMLALALLAVHIGTAVADTYAPIRLKDAVVPFVSAYRPIWLGLGALAFDLLLAVTITSLVRARIGFRRWKLLHWLAYAVWPVALVHALGTGSDARLGWLQLVAITATLAVLAAVLVRIGLAPGSSRVRVTVAATVVAVPIAVGAWYTSGPARRGWAARSGTPAALVAPRQIARRPPARSAPPSLPRAPFTTRFAGRLRESSTGNGLTLVDIRGTTRGAAAGRLWIRLQGIPSGGGVALTASGASYGPPTWPDAYVGDITALDGTRLALSLRGHDGRLRLLVDLAIDQTTGKVTGIVRAEPRSEQSE